MSLTREEIIEIIEETLGAGKPSTAATREQYGSEVSRWSTDVSITVSRWCGIVTKRGLKYSLSLYYDDLAWLIRQLIKLEWFTNSLMVWEEWANELEDRAEDPLLTQHAMVLPEFTKDPVTMTSTLDLIVRYMLDVIRQEEQDTDYSMYGYGMNPLTLAECAKITERFTRKLEDFLYTLRPNYPGSNVMVKVPWPLISAAQKELEHVYKKLGEVNRAGSTGTPTGPLPPISWPG